MCSADAKSEYLLYETDDIDTENRRLFSIKTSSIDEKCDKI